MTTAQLTPQANQSPAVVSGGNELSGSQWVARFPGSNSTSALTPEFSQSVDRFIEAMRDAGATITVSATYRPPQRAYLMHWSWKIAHGTPPSAVPTMDGVNIEWVHPTLEASVRAARDMVNAYGMQNLQIAAALVSRHTQRKAIDMTIGWSGSLAIRNASDELITISSTPRTGMNATLKQVGQSYGVIKFVGGASDKPHWSTDGH
ncbi:hypothetical protein LMG18101_02109 [Ralstonia flaminis]|jgi:hypothetical protein|uniref:Peptidoglycan-binding domain-containing protein n=2 Tax=Ralstonia flaminis TaxID=3058597 RepID=A0ABN9JMT8_9RALS|nr:hypothetical protein LMG18101_02109 [Ralstonia sp. LMG 18101]